MVNCANQIRDQIEAILATDSSVDSISSFKRSIRGYRDLPSKIIDTRSYTVSYNQVFNDGITRLKEIHENASRNEEVNSEQFDEFKGLIANIANEAKKRLDKVNNLKVRTVELFKTLNRLQIEIEYSIAALRRDHMNKIRELHSKNRSLNSAISSLARTEEDLRQIRYGLFFYKTPPLVHALRLDIHNKKRKISELIIIISNLSSEFSGTGANISNTKRTQSQHTELKENAVALRDTSTKLVALLGEMEWRFDNLKKELNTQKPSDLGVSCADMDGLEKEMCRFLVLNEILPQLTEEITQTWLKVAQQIGNDVVNALQYAIRNRSVSLNIYPERFVENFNQQKEDIQKVDDYVRRILDTEGFAEYKKLNPHLLTAKNNVIDWIGDVKPRVNLLYENLARYRSDISKVRNKVNFQCDTEILIKYVLPVVLHIFKEEQIADIEKNGKKNVIRLKALLLIKERLTQLRMNQADEVEVALCIFRELLSTDQSIFERELPIIQSLSNNTKQRFEELENDRIKLNDDVQATKRAKKEAIEERDRLQKIDIGISILATATAFLLIPFTGGTSTAIAVTLLAGAAVTKYALIVNISDLSLKILALESDLDKTAFDIYLLFAQIQGIKINTRKLDQYVTELTAINNLIGSARGKLSIIFSYYSFTGGRLRDVMYRIDSVSEEVRVRQFCLLETEVDNMNKSYFALLQAVTNPESLRGKRSIYEHAELVSNIPPVIYSDEETLLKDFIVRSTNSPEDAKEFKAVLEEELNALNDDDSKYITPEIQKLLPESIKLDITKNHEKKHLYHDITKSSHVVKRNAELLQINASTANLVPNLLLVGSSKKDNSYITNYRTPDANTTLVGINYLLASVSKDYQKQLKKISQLKTENSGPNDNFITLLGTPQAEEKLNKKWDKIEKRQANTFLNFVNTTNVSKNTLDRIN